VFVLAVAVLTSDLFGSIYACAAIWIKREQDKRIIKGYLKHLTDSEKKVLRGYMDSESQLLDYADGVRGGLEAKGIIYQSSSVGHSYRMPRQMLFSYNVQPWVRRFLLTRPEIIAQHRESSH